MSDTALQEYRTLTSAARRTFGHFVSTLNRRDTYDLALNYPRYALTDDRRAWLVENLKVYRHQTEHLQQELDRFDGRLRALERVLEMDES